MHLDAVGDGHQGDEQADRAGPQHQQAFSRCEPGAAQRTQRVATGLDERADSRFQICGQGVQRRGRHHQLLRERAGETASNAHLVTELADVLVTAQAAPAHSAAQHGVAGDPSAEPGLVDAGPDRRHDAAPLVAEPHRERGLAVVQIAHLAGEELDVGAADPDPLHVDHHLTGGGDRRRHFAARRTPAGRSGRRPASSSSGRPPPGPAGPRVRQTHDRAAQLRVVRRHRPQRVHPSGLDAPRAALARVRRAAPHRDRQHRL